MTQLVAGDTAPEFALPYAGEDISLSDYRDSTVVVYFYPAAMTPGCTTQAIDFTSSYDAFNDAGITVLGISPDSVDRLEEFRAAHNIAIPLLSDENREAIDAYHAWGTRNVYGKHIEGVLRSTFVIDVDSDGIGTIRMAQYNVRANGHVERLKRDLGLESS